MFEDIKCVFRSRKSKEVQCMVERRRTKWQTLIYKIPYSGTPEGSAVVDQLVTPVVLLLSDTNIIWRGHRVGHQ